eukprot:scaffold136931_cov32-Tisochrysis_lutea.AAC.2
MSRTCTTPPANQLPMRTVGSWSISLSTESSTRIYCSARPCAEEAVAASQRRRPRSEGRSRCRGGRSGRDRSARAAAIEPRPNNSLTTVS